MLALDPSPTLLRQHIKTIKVIATGINIFMDASWRLTCSSLLSRFQDASMRRQRPEISAKRVVQPLLGTATTKPSVQF